MANRTVSGSNIGWHGTLTASAEDVVTFDRDLDRWELIVEAGTTAPVYYTADHRTAVIPANNTAAVVGVVLPGSAVVESAVGGGNSQIHLISAGAAVYHIVGTAT